MTDLKIVIADDEPLAAERLERLLKKIDDVELVGTAEDGEEAVALSEEKRPDLLLLDVAMPGMDGIEVARALSKGKNSPAVIFVTAFDRFAVAAFEVAAVDYLMKPVDAKRLAVAIDRARDHIVSHAEADHDVAEKDDEDSPWLTEFWASDLSGLVRIAADDIDRVSAERDYMRLHVGERSWLIHYSMTKLEEGLDPSKFVRLHRSALVRRDFVAGFSRNASGRWVARLQDGTEQAVGRLYADRVREMAGR
ncbi:LytR/AlgR family response regulator transcription factor [Sphingomicrobium clamense]|uniref:LytTR family DNA-binding domain-containing protein n=1 Tax=Sphingomicrobium clamense TaxID=2851013 RepID=A0ABS6V6D8_9SPHN|nr:LytTR family DNA-binding domain-containing protein [Sphingomicrobium sp. B8]MBW0144638.1 LytTR family DNA-binding domain-containing protein [Sphingomicrobium sp. B8]